MSELDRSVLSLWIGIITSSACLVMVAVLGIAWGMYLFGPPGSTALTVTGRPNQCISAVEAAASASEAHA